MSVVAGLARAAGAKVLTGRRPARKVLPRTKGTLVVMALALLALATLISASETIKVKHSPAASTNSEAVAAAPVSQPAAAPQMSEREALDAYGKLPLSFVANEGQMKEEAVRYYAQGAGYGFFFTKEGATLSFAEGKGRGGHALALDFQGADPDATLTAQERLSGEVNYLVGDDPANWQQNLPTHAELLYGGLWPGIDMAVRGEGGKLKYEFHLKPGASVEDVRLGYRGAEGLSVGAGGQLLVQTSLGVLKDAAPVSYQRIGGERVPVQSRYKLTGDGGYGFAVGAYDPRYPLVIDPELDYSTFLGGAAFDEGSDIAVRFGRAYVTGETSSTDYPTTPGAFDRTPNGFSDAFVTKLNASGSALAYSTFLGGTGDDFGEGIAVRFGRAYVTGETSSTDYPTTPGAFDRTPNGFSDAFVTKLNASGSALVYSTYLGGASTEFSADIAVDGMSRAHVTGQTRSADYPTTQGAFDRTFNGGIADAFVTKLNASGSALAYSTYLGGTDFDQGHGIAVNGGRAYVMGTTSSTDYPTTQGAFDRTPNGDVDAFVTKFNASGSALEYSTYLGGTHSDEGGGDIAVLDGRAYVTGTTSSIDYPTTQGAFDTSLGGFQDAFVTKFNASGSALVYSTYLGGTSGERGEGIAVDGSGRAYVTGVTFSADYPTTPDAFDTSFNDGVQDAFVTKLNASGSKLAYSTFLGGTSPDAGLGIAVRFGRAYVTGRTSSDDYPATPGAFDRTFNGSEDAFVTKLPTG
jgi:beta-propeller repeat-containing protein